MLASLGSSAGADWPETSLVGSPFLKGYSLKGSLTLPQPSYNRRVEDKPASKARWEELRAVVDVSGHHNYIPCTVSREFAEAPLCFQQPAAGIMLRYGLTPRLYFVSWLWRGFR